MGRYDNILELERDLNGEDLRIGIVMSRFNMDVGEGLLRRLHCGIDKTRGAGVGHVAGDRAGCAGDTADPQKMALTDQFDALIALGAVIRGETYHFEIVANQSASGLAAVQLDTGIPVVNGILTTETDDQAMARMSQKGTEAAQVAIEMANLLRELEDVTQ